MYGCVTFMGLCENFYTFRGAFYHLSTFYRYFLEILDLMRVKIFSPGGKNLHHMCNCELVKSRGVGCKKIEKEHPPGVQKF